LLGLSESAARSSGRRKENGVALDILPPQLSSTGYVHKRDSAPDIRFPRRLNGGWWNTSHVQGITVDRVGGYVYYSFTTLLVKSDLRGNVVATVGGFTGHLGDLDFNDDDRRVYASLEYKEANAFYVAIFDGDAMTQLGMDAQASPIVSTVHLAEVVEDFTATVEGDGAPVRHRHGCSGIDGVSFGPAFGTTEGQQVLTVAYGVFADEARDDNDHQILLQYSVSEWYRYERPLVEVDPHTSGPLAPDGKYFVHTGNTTYGVQNLAYDGSLRRWFLGVYPGTKPAFPNYTLFAIDADTQPHRTLLAGDSSEAVVVLPLAAAGLEDPTTGIRGWHQKADVGIKALGDGMFYLSTNSVVLGLQTSEIELCRWTGLPSGPFESQAHDASFVPS
jgi:hypothetical protein